MESVLADVAIIGAGLGGCALALTLAAHRIPVRIYEARSPSLGTFASGVILTPNGLWVLDKLGVFERIRNHCYVATHRVIRNAKDEIVSKNSVADESAYGYLNHRVWRHTLLDTMLEMLRQQSVPIHYHSKFQGIVSEGQDGVRFRINETTCAASLVIGSDGIYSAVRDYVAPGVRPEFTGTIGILSHVKRSSIAWPHEDYERNATLQGPKGAIFYIAEDIKADDLMIGTQVQSDEYSRDTIAALLADKDKLASYYENIQEGAGPTAKKIIEKVIQDKDKLWIWPYMRVPVMNRWYSLQGRVIIVGDAAHGLPPSSGQGVNQALEDVYSLTMMLRHTNSRRADGVSGASGLTDGLRFWQHSRQQKVDAIFEWATSSQNVDRMPEKERMRIQAQRGSARTDDMSWLYRPTIESDIKTWIDGRATTTAG